MFNKPLDSHKEPSGVDLHQVGEATTAPCTGRSLYESSVDEPSRPSLGTGKMLQQPWRWLMIACGMLALGLGIVGIFLPLLPTTPFVLLAAFFFSKGSERLHRWLLNHPKFGIYIRDWEAEQVIPLVGKCASTFTMVPLVSWAILTREIPWILELTMVATVAGTLWFVWTRPSHRSVPTAQPAGQDRALRPPTSQHESQ